MATIDGIKKTQDELLNASVNGSRSDAAGKLLAGNNNASVDNSTATLEEIRAKNNENLRKKEIADHAKSLGMNKTDFLNWVQKYLGYSEQQLYSLSEEEYTASFIEVVLEASCTLKNNIKNGNLATKEAKDLLDNFGKKVLDYKATGLTNSDIEKLSCSGDKTFQIDAKNFQKGYRGEELKNKTFLDLLKNKDSRLNQYNSINDIPKKELVACIKGMMTDIIKGLQKNGSDKNFVKASFMGFQKMLADMPNDQYVTLMEAIREEFEVDELKKAIKTTLEKTNNDKDIKNLDLLIQYFEKQGKKLGFGKDEINQLIITFKDVKVIEAEAKDSLKKARESFETPEKRETFDHIQMKIRVFLQINAEKIKNDPKYVITAEDLGLTSDLEKEVFAELDETLKTVAFYESAIINNKRCDTTEEDKKAAIEDINQQIEEFGVDRAFYNLKLREVVNDIADKNPDFFDGKSIKEVYDLINEYTKGEFGEDTGCYGNKPAESFKNTNNEKAKTQTKNESIGFDTKQPVEVNPKDTLQVLYAQTEENNSGVEIVGKQNDNNNFFGFGLKNGETFASINLNALSKENIEARLSLGKITINQLFKQCKNTTNDLGKIVTAMITGQASDKNRVNLLNRLSNNGVKREIMLMCNNFNPESAKKVILDFANKNLAMEGLQKKQA